MSGFMEEYGMHVLDVLNTIPDRVLDFQGDEEKMKKIMKKVRELVKLLDRLEKEL